MLLENKMLIYSKNHMNLNVLVLLWHGAVLPADLIADADGQALVPVLSLLVHTVMETLQNLQLTAFNLREGGHRQEEK